MNKICLWIGIVLMVCIFGMFVAMFISMGNEMSSLSDFDDTSYVWWFIIL